MLSESGCRQRRAKLWARLPESITAAIVADPRHVSYLTNFRVQPLSFSRDERAILLLERDGGSADHDGAGKATLAADNFTAKSADGEAFYDSLLEVPWYDHVHSVTNRDHATFAALAKRGSIGGKTLLEAEWCPAMVGEVCRDSLKTDAELHFQCPATGERVSLGTLLRDLRRQKLPDEIECLNWCMRAGDAGHAKAFEVIRPGVTDLEVYNAVATACNEVAGRPGIVYGDWRSTRRGRGKAGGLPVGETLEQGDLFILDYSFVLHGYRSDFTNTYAVGEPSARQRELFDACHSALKAGEGVLKAGAKASAVYDACSGVLVDAGFGKLSHHAGHGLGMGHPEPPIEVPESRDELRENDVVTLEPGSYHDDIGGVRVEHNYRITATGYERLSNHRIALTR
ncbi:M24 family metallopeptidase [Alienimonas californiensis]|uniref:Putative peptidase n=1 Tax=Alienimonas californiensis TaxID=2527989 RepID=A0A517PBR7_9PLAN|nr:Xaa-Pro peptidase family protein [Alienimonas californiensis]QDT16824.1 putative peptidase [Alienimonas californiensis]